MKLKEKGIIISLLSIVFNLNAQSEEVYRIANDSTTKRSNTNYEEFIIPAVLIGYGAIGTQNGGLKGFDLKVKRNIGDFSNKQIKIDDYIQYAPALSVYFLNNIGIEGKNNFRDRTIILATSTMIMGGVITGLKYTTGIERPDGSKNNSFPSGHTALAFAGAEFLFQEYKEVSFWYGFSGYIVATATGIFRIYNDRHWLTDVIAGAGIGILSTKLAYLIYPYLQNKVFKFKDDKKAAALLPFYNGKEVGASFGMTF
ncbi:phosphatase PAP2 family protein [Flavobacterium sp. '19STA2R22 D10 B1']|uniref:phosphatase PAP2 family protein n=1 Tax=Flavobacterium aerium TaxID=3037261 RepID=UPI00278C2C1C|nr:phosphatase PAP2 family protein [Flavobacterium sp. '19STA2R22 D10 B1']